MIAPDPCPRCGSVCEAVRGPVPDRWGVRCIECGLWADDREGTKAEAIAAWNRRALPATDAREKALREAVKAGMRIAMETPIERVPAAVDAAILALIGEART